MKLRAAMAMVVLVLGTVPALPRPARGDDYAYKTAEPQPSGWPLTDVERKYILKPEYERRPGSEVMKHLPAMWPVVPSAGFWTGTAWLDTHARLVEYVKQNKGKVDFLLVGDSITQQWGSPLDNKPMNAGWVKQFGMAKVVNIGIGGDKSQNVLWRLDHGGADELEPKCILLMIGNNNMFFVPETGVEPAAKGVKACADNLRRKFPKAPIIIAKILPAHEPGNEFYENIKKTNLAVDLLRLDADKLVRVLDLTADMVNTDGTVKQELYKQDKIHLSEAGYALYAAKLRPVIDAVLSEVKE
jgi:platelet-activating factor acetylhydrolase IB subunit beta/gamma